MIAGWKFLGVSVLVVAVGAAGWTQHGAGQRLRDEIAVARNRSRDLARLREENRRMKAAQVSDAELERLRSDRAATEQLRSELESLKRSVAQRSKAQPDVASETSSSAAPTPALLITERMVPPSAWRNAGRGTPAATLESLLWAAAGGDVEAVASSLILEGEARAQAEALYARLPEEARRGYGSAEKLVALFAAKDVPLGEAHIAGPWEPPHHTKVSLQMRETSEGPPRMAVFQLREEAGEWKVIVPASAVEKYAAALQKPGDVVMLAPVEAK